MNQNDTDRIYFNQNLIYHKDILYNSGGSLEISINNHTVDYKTFAPPSLRISVIGENNLRRICTLNYPDSVDLFSSIKDVLSNIENIYSTGRSNVILKKYQFDKSLKFEFVLIQSSGERVVIISVTHSLSDFAKVIIPYCVFSAFAIGILKYYINDFVNIAFTFSNRSLITEMLEHNKQTVNLLRGLPGSLVEVQSFGNNPSSVTGVSAYIGEYYKKYGEYPETLPSEEEINKSNQTEKTLEDFDTFLGPNMENIKVLDFESKAITEEKPKNLEIKSLLIPKTLTNNLSVLESMLNASITKPDSLICMLEGFRRSMNLGSDFSFLPGISKNDLKSLLYISKRSHDLFINLYLVKNVSIPSGFQILKYDPPKDKISPINLQLAYDLLLIFGFIKIYRSRMESRDADANKNGSIFYLRLRSFLDPLVYSFLDEKQGNLISNNLVTFFEVYNEKGFFNEYQSKLEDNGFQKITVNDIKTFCNELTTKVFSKDILSINIGQKHKDLYEAQYVRINSDNNLTIEQIINELIPLEVLEKCGSENPDVFDKYLNSVSEEVRNIFIKKEEVPEKKGTESNILKTVKFFNNEIPSKRKDDMLTYLTGISLNEIDFSKFEAEEFGENIIKAFYIWNESENKKEAYTEFRSKLENCLLTKDLIITKYKSGIDNKDDIPWDLE